MQAINGTTAHPIRGAAKAPRMKHTLGNAPSVTILSALAAFVALALDAGPATAGDTASASVGVEIVKSVGIEPGSDGLGFALSGEDGLLYDLVLPPAAPTTDVNGRPVAVELSRLDARPHRGSWTLAEGSDVVKLAPIIHRRALLEPAAMEPTESTADRAVTGSDHLAGSTGRRDDELPVFIAYQ